MIPNHSNEGFIMSLPFAVFPLFMVRRACKYLEPVTSQPLPKGRYCQTHIARQGGSFRTIYAPTGKTYI